MNKLMGFLSGTNFVITVNSLIDGSFGQATFSGLCFVACVLFTWDDA